MFKELLRSESDLLLKWDYKDHWIRFYSGPYSGPFRIIQYIVLDDYHITVNW